MAKPQARRRREQARWYVPGTVDVFEKDLILAELSCAQLQVQSQNFVMCLQEPWCPLRSSITLMSCMQCWCSSFLLTHTDTQTHTDTHSVCYSHIHIPFPWGCAKILLPLMRPCLIPTSRLLLPLPAFPASPLPHTFLLTEASANRQGPDCELDSRNANPGEVASWPATVFQSRERWWWQGCQAIGNGV